MNIRRFEHPTKHRFWEAYWEVMDVEIVSGAIGSNGRATRKEFRSHLACEEYVQAEIAKRVKEGFEEVVPEIVAVKNAPKTEPPPELLARILEAPDEDQPRMVYADWLHQHGDPLGELIAVQLEIARLDPYEPVPKPLRDREENLFGNFRARWLPDIVGATVTFVRGFADTIKVEIPFERDVIDRVVAVAPLIRTLAFAQLRDAWQSDLRPWQNVSADALRRFSGLSMGGFRVNADAIRQLLDLDMPRLDRLAMRSMQIGPSMAKPIYDREWVELDLHQNNLGARGVGMLVDGDRSKLAVLDIGSNEIGNAGLQLLALTKLPALRRLSLRRSNLASNGMKLLSSMPSLVALDLSCNAFGGAFDFDLPRLRELDLRETALDDAGLRRLAASPLAKTIAMLDVANNPITDAAPLRAFPVLRSLYISNTPLAKAKATLDLPGVRIVARTTKATVG